MKRILISLAMIAAVGAIVVGATTAYFSDTETSTGNTFTAGTIDVHITGNNFTWTEGAALDDMKPCYTDYINFTIYNDGSDPNPVNVWKYLKNFAFDGGVLSEPEGQEQCENADGVWNDVNLTCTVNYTDDNAIDKVILYDMVVEVYKDGGTEPIWWQTIYDEEYDLADLNGGIFLGMIPANGFMKVTQSYHMNPDTTNWAQGDKLTFDIEIKAEQLHGEAWLDEKQAKKDGEDYWKVQHPYPGIPAGTLTYEVKHPTFDFKFTGVAPKPNHNYDLVAITDIPNDKGVLLGTDLSNGSGNIIIEGDIQTGHLKDAKVWLITKGHFDPTTGVWSGWSPNDYLWETGLIWYEDTDL